MSELEDLVNRQEEEFRDRLDVFSDEIIDNVTDTVLKPIEGSIRDISLEIENAPEVWQFQSESMDGPVVITDLSRGHGHRRRHPKYRSGRVTIAVLISDEKEHVESFFELLELNIDNITSMVGEFVDIESFYYGEDHVGEYFDNLISNDYAENWYTDKIKDDFEQEVYNLVNNYSAICKQNVNVELNLGENPEYDIVSLPLGEYGDAYAIEVKNYDRDHIDEVDDPLPDNLRSALITHPREEAERVNLELITVVKGLTDEQYNDVKRHAGPSDVVLLNEDNYKEELKEELVLESIKQIQSIISK